jgi:hypothetical protein
MFVLCVLYSSRTKGKIHDHHEPRTDGVQSTREGMDVCVSCCTVKTKGKMPGQSGQRSTAKVQRDRERGRGRRRGGERERERTKSCRGHGILFQVQAFATGRSLVQGRSTECKCACLCDHMQQ